MTNGLDGETRSSARGADRRPARYSVAAPGSNCRNLQACASPGSRPGRPDFDPHFGWLYDTYARHRIVHQWAALLSPLVAIRRQTAIAATDLEDRIAASSPPPSAIGAPTSRVMNVDMTTRIRAPAIA